MSLPHFPSGKPNHSWTFANFRDWINSREAGLGDQFIAWVQANNDVPPPYVFDINSSTFGPGGFGSNNTAFAWFNVWFAQAVVGPAIGAKLKEGIQKGAKLIPKALKGTAQGIGDVPGAKALSGLDAIGAFFSSLGEANTWLRVGEVALGLILIAVGVAKLTNAVPLATKIAGIVK